MEEKQVNKPHRHHKSGQKVNKRKRNKKIDRDEETMEQARTRNPKAFVVNSYVNRNKMTQRKAELKKIKNYIFL